MIETVVWYIQNIGRQAIQMLPCMGIALLGWMLMYPLRRAHLTRLHLSSSRGREALLLIYVLFLAGLFGLTLVPFGFWGDLLRALLQPGYQFTVTLPSWEEALQRLRELPGSITPFQEILRVNLGGPWLKFIFLGNIGMFAPIGFSLPLLWRKRHWYHALLTGALFSCSIEVLQVFVGRVSDIDDVLLNTLGTMAGYLLFLLVAGLFPSLRSRFHCTILQRGE